MKLDWVETIRETCMRWIRKVGEGVANAASLLWRIVAGVLGAVLGLIVVVVGAVGFVFVAFLMFGIGTVIWEKINPTPADDKAWSETSRGSNDEQISNLLKFAETYPQSHRKTEVGKRVEELAWKIAETPDDPQKPRFRSGLACVPSTALAPRTYSRHEYSSFSYSDYLRAYPSGSHAKEAQAKLEEICWNYAKANDSDEGYSLAFNHLRYLELYPEGKWKIDARSYISGRYYDVGIKQWSREYLQKALDYMSENDFRRESATKALDEMVSWANAIETDTYEAFRHHLQAWPEGHTRSHATAMMEYHGRWKQMPFSEKIFSVLSKGFRDSVELEDISIYVEDTEIKEKCLANQDFADLLNGYVLAARYHDDYRRRVYFGFDAPFADRSKSGIVDVLKALELDQLRPIVLGAWKAATLNSDQRRQLKRLAVIALAHEKLFDAGYDQTAADILTARWQPKWFKGWHELQGFRKLADPCYGLGFHTFPDGITSTLFDFWYMRAKDGTKKIASMAFQALADADNTEQR